MRKTNSFRLIANWHSKCSVWTKTLKSWITRSLRETKERNNLLNYWKLTTGLLRRFASRNDRNLQKNGDFHSAAG